MSDITLEKVEEVMDRSHAEFHAAKQALVDAGGDVEGAVKLLAKEAEEPVDAEFRKAGEPAAETAAESKECPAEESPAEGAKPDAEGAEDAAAEAEKKADEAEKTAEPKKDWKADADRFADSFSDSVNDVVDKIKDIVSHGNADRIVITRKGETLLNMPVNAGLIGGAIGLFAAPWAMVAAIVAAFGFKCKIEVVKKDGTREGVQEEKDDDDGETDGSKAVDATGAANAASTTAESMNADTKAENDGKEAHAPVIKAVKLYKGGYMTQPFAFGGEEGMDKFDPAVKYRSSLQNYVIDTGREVILVDTGMPDGLPDQVPDEKTMIYMGTRIEDYVPALETAGYKPEQVTKILITHKHGDHTGALVHFPKAEILTSEVEAKSDELKSYPNVHSVTFDDGPYYNFPASKKIADGITYIPAPGHTNGTCIVIVEADGLFYMIHGDITYTDEALYQNKLSIVFEDKDAARTTLDQVREFIRNHPTVYVSTHTPLGYENLEKKAVVDLDHMPEPLPVEEDPDAKQATGKYICSVCGYVYDPAVGDPDNGIPAGTAFEDLPDDWKCPRCRQGKDKFNKA